MDTEKKRADLEELLIKIELVDVNLVIASHLKALDHIDAQTKEINSLKEDLNQSNINFIMSGNDHSHKDSVIDAQAKEIEKMKRKNNQRYTITIEQLADMFSEQCRDSG